MLSVEQRNLFLIKNINHSQAPEATQPRTMKNGRNTMQTYRKTLIVHFLVEQSLHFSFHSEGSRVGFFSFFPPIFVLLIRFLPSISGWPSFPEHRPKPLKRATYLFFLSLQSPQSLPNACPPGPNCSVLASKDCRRKKKKKTTHCSIMNHIPGEGWWNRRLVCLQHQHQ